MTQTVIHQPRIAWDGARLFVGCLAGPDYPWLLRHASALLGEAGREQLTETRARLVLAGSRGEAALELASHTAAGLWRVRLEDLMRTRPELAQALADLIRQRPERH